VCVFAVCESTVAIPLTSQNPSQGLLVIFVFMSGNKGTSPEDTKSMNSNYGRYTQEKKQTRNANEKPNQTRNASNLTELSHIQLPFIYIHIFTRITSCISYNEKDASHE
jgi:hypothetical protein